MVMPILNLKQVSVRFGGLTAVNRLDCAVEAGQIFSIIGPNGAGKTTVFNAITGIYEPASGVIEFEGRRTAASVQCQGGACLRGHWTADRAGPAAGRGRSRFVVASNDQAQLSGPKHPLQLRLRMARSQGLFSRRFGDRASWPALVGAAGGQQPPLGHGKRRSRGPGRSG